VKRFSLVSVVVVVAVLAVSSGAGAATTIIGQVAPTTPPLSCANSDPYDALQPTVTSGNTYVVPVDGTITSWSNNSGVGTGQVLTFKIFRKAAGVNEYLAVAHDIERPLDSGALKTFNVNFPVKAGDFIGIDDGIADTSCDFPVPGETGYYEHLGSLADGVAGTFFSRSGVRLNLSAALTTPDAVAKTLACKGKPATILGTTGNDQVVGTAGPDVIAALGGNDKVSGLGANDLICGGPGKDRLNGGKGKDRLYGQGGADKLKGAGGNDVCKGGKGKDSLSSC
jgi:Ca2+-binding RTX toxin-like protein